MKYTKTPLMITLMMAFSGNVIAVEVSNPITNEEEFKSYIDSDKNIHLTGNGPIIEIVNGQDGFAMSEDDVLNQFNIDAGTGTAISVAKDATDKVNLYINSKQSTINTKGETAIYIGGKNDLGADAHGDVAFYQNQYLKVDAKKYALVAENDGGLEVDSGVVDFNGSVKVTKNGWVNLGYFSKYDFPADWEDEASKDEPPSTFLESISIKSSADNTPALHVSHGAGVSMAADKITISHTSKSKNTAIEIISSESVETDEGLSSTAVDIYAKKELHIQGDIVIDVTENGIKDGYVNIRSGDKTKIQGDIITVNDAISSNVVQIALNGKESSFTGAIKDQREESQIALLTENRDKKQGTFLTLNDGATVNLTAASNITGMNSNGGVINANEFDVSLSNVKSTSLVIYSTNLSSKTALEKLDGSIQKVYDVDTSGMTPEEVAEKIKGNNTTGSRADDSVFKVATKEQSSGSSYEGSVDKDGSVKDWHEQTNSVSDAVTDIASVQMLAWRAQFNDVNKRLGDLRTYDGLSGGWARVYGGKSEYGDRDLENKYTTIQIGADTKVMNNFYIGVTSSYTEGEGKIINGSSDAKSYSLGVYGGWLADNGQFADVIIQHYRTDTDFDLFYRGGEKSTGGFHTWGTSISAEYGWRVHCPTTKFWVEPQLELSYGRLQDVTYTTTSQRIKQDSMDSLVGRIGVAFGRDFDQGSAYLKASVAHDWLGESAVKMSSLSGIGQADYREQDLGGTWGEVSFGGTVNFTKSFSGYGEFQTSFGSPVDTPYQWNVGLRYTF